jgi:DUF2075 family protein
MIVYRATKEEFQTVARESDLGEVIQTAFKQATGRSVGASEVQSWSASLHHMSLVLNDLEIPGDAGVGIEFHVPPLRKRIDFLLSGHNQDGKSAVVVIELKQWSEAKRTSKDGVMETRFKAGVGEVPHPSYQAWSYTELMRAFCEPVADGSIALHPCAYLHNHPDSGDVLDPFYAEHLQRAPVFTKGGFEKQKLRAFLRQHVVKGDVGAALYEIERGKIRPSKALADAVVSMLQGNPEFVLLDNQKVVYETARAMWASPELDEKKMVLIIEGGPGTGKSVVAVNLLVDAIERRHNAGYVTKNAAPREVFQHRLASSALENKSTLSGLFHGSGEFIDAKPGSWDVLVVDEAHRLREKSGLYGNLGNHQIGEIINAGRRVVFLIDERQRVTAGDIGSKAEIRRWAKQHGAVVEELKLVEQFRCAGSTEYVGWIERALDMAKDAPAFARVAEEHAGYAVKSGAPSEGAYDLRVFDSPRGMLDEIRALDGVGSARMVAGYCWAWKSQKSPGEYDVEIPEHEFRMRWNLKDDGGLWIVAEDSVEQVGCIHTCQGLEVDYIGVIIGPDMVVRDGKVVTDFTKRARHDSSIKGLKGRIKKGDTRALVQADEIVRNTYFTLMTRGMKGCFLYSTDAETQEYLRKTVSDFQAEVGIKD